MDRPWIPALGRDDDKGADFGFGTLALVAFRAARAGAHDNDLDCYGRGLLERKRHRERPGTGPWSFALRLVLRLLDDALLDQILNPFISESQ